MWNSWATKCQNDLSIDGNEVSTDAGDGPVDATLAQLKRYILTVRNCSYIKFATVTEGTDAQATVTVRMTTKEIFLQANRQILTL